MKTQKNKLSFDKSTMLELNDDVLLEINGGTTIVTTSSTYCIAAGTAAMGAFVAYTIHG